MPNFIFPYIARDVDALSYITLDHITLINLSYLQPWWAALKHTGNVLPKEPISLGFRISLAYKELYSVASKYKPEVQGS